MVRRTLDMSLRTVWAQVAEVRERLETELATLPEEVRAATIMTASELVENALKYGEPVAGAPRASFAVALDHGLVELTVRSGARSAAAVAELEAMVAQLAAAPDRRELYLQALQRTMTSTDGRSGLGLYRIGFEGGFELECTYADEVVTMRATRRFPQEVP